MMLARECQSIFQLLDQTPLNSDILLLHQASKEQVEEMFGEIYKANMLAVDLETTGRNSQADGLNPFQGEIRLYQICIRIRVLNEFQYKTLIVDSFKTPKKQLSLFIEVLRGVCESKKKAKIFHNAIFDLNWLRIQHGIRSHFVRDTMIMSRMLYAGMMDFKNTKFVRIDHDLGSCVERELGVKLDKSNQTDDWFVYDLTNTQLNYAANDSIYTFKLFFKLAEQIKAINMASFFNITPRYTFAEVVGIECDFIPVMSEIVATGQPIDLAYARDVLRQYTEAANDLYAPVFEKIGLPFSAQSQKMSQKIKEVYGVILKDIKDPDKDSAGGEALFLAYDETGIEDLMKVSLARNLKKTIDTLEKIIKSAEMCGGYARGNYSSLEGKASGRSGCSGKSKTSKSSWECLNLQNIPNHNYHPLLAKYNLPPIRSVIKHKEYSDVMALYDLSSSHARYAATKELSGDISLVEVLERKDPHSYLTLKIAELSGKDWDMSYYEANLKTDKELKEFRSVSKTALYGCFNNGNGTTFYNSLLGAYQNIPLDLCHKAREALTEAFPGFFGWVDSAKWAIAKSNNTIERDGVTFVRWITPSGRLYHCELLEKTSARGFPYKTVRAGNISSACLISAEAIAEKKAGKRMYEYLCDNPDKPYQINSFTHDDYSVSDFTEEKLFMQFAYDCIADEFTRSLGDVPSTMTPGDGKWKKGIISNYSEK